MQTDLGQMRRVFGWVRALPMERSMHSLSHRQLLSPFRLSTAVIHVSQMQGGTHSLRGPNRVRGQQLPHSQRLPRVQQLSLFGLQSGARVELQRFGVRP